MSTRVKSVLIVDDGPVIRKLGEMLTRDGDFDICGEARTVGKQLKRLNNCALI